MVKVKGKRFEASFLLSLLHLYIWPHGVSILLGLARRTVTGTVLSPTAFSEVFLKSWNNRKILPETRIIVASLIPSSGGTKSEGEVAHHVVWRSHGFPERRWAATA